MENIPVRSSGGNVFDTFCHRNSYVQLNSTRKSTVLFEVFYKSHGIKIIHCIKDISDIFDDESLSSPCGKMQGNKSTE
jgi:hypothetical protein